MSNPIKKFIKNFSYTFSANMISMVVSVILTLIVPKAIGVKEYGYWQLYIFYISYVGFLHLGWSDGVYLRYGGYEYSKLDSKIFVTQFWIMTIVEIIISIVLSVICLLFTNDLDKGFIWIATFISGVILILRSFLYYILQATNKIREFAIYTITERILYFVLTLIMLYVGIRNYRYLIYVDIISKFISLALSMYSCRRLVFGKLTMVRENICEIIRNVNVGIKLMIANIASMLIIGVVRLGIQYQWNIETFGKVSLTMSISNLLMIFINAVGVIMFPTLRRTSSERLPLLYNAFRCFLMVLLFAMLIFYYPIMSVLSLWLPQYAESLRYMALLFPLCIFESKMSMLINTYLKSLRKESYLLKVNIITVILSVVTTIITVFVFENLSLSIVSIVFLLAFRCIMAENMLAKLLKIDIKKDFIYEILLSIIFIFTSWFIGGTLSVVIYIIFYFCYVILKKKELHNTYILIKGMIKQK